MVVLEMATGKPAWPNPAVATFKICATEEMPPVPDSLSPAAHDFLEQVCEGAGHDPSLSTFRATRYPTFAALPSLPMYVAQSDNY